MSTKHIMRAQKALNSRPGGKAMTGRKYAKIALAVFAAAALTAVGLLLAEVSTPGMAWYVYE